MTPNIKQIIAEMREKEKECTQGLWRNLNPECADGINFVRIDGGHKGPHVATLKEFTEDLVCYTHKENSAANADFIAFTRNNITAILDYVAELEQRIKFLEETDLRHLD